jgi:hypothetical protein
MAVDRIDVRSRAQQAFARYCLGLVAYRCAEAFQEKYDSYTHFRKNNMSIK